MSAWNSWELWDIPTGDALSIRERFRRIPRNLFKEVKKHIQLYI